MHTIMKGRIGTASHLSYARPYWGKEIYKLNYIHQLSPQAKIRYKAINLYSSGNYSVSQICEIFEINRSTFYRWRERYKQSRVQSLEDRSKKPHQLRTKVWSSPDKMDTQLSNSIHIFVGLGTIIPEK